jgi:DNA-binding HxlR family transcriptional regulator
MAPVKESSTNQLNKQRILSLCPITYTLGKIGGRWKPLIIHALLSGAKRYSELKRSVPNITEKMLIQHLKEMEEDGLVLRKAEPVVPPVVTYSLSENGLALGPVLNSMVEWAFQNTDFAGHRK